MKRAFLFLGLLLCLLLPLHATSQDSSQFPSITPQNAFKLIQIAEFDVSQFYSSDIQLKFNASGDLLLVGYSLPYMETAPHDFGGGALLINVADWTQIDQLDYQPVAFNPDGTLLAVGEPDGMIRILDAYTGVEQQRLAGHISPIHSLAFSPDGTHLASGDATGLVWIRNLTSGELHVLSAFTERPYTNVNRLRFSPNGQWLVAYSWNLAGYMRIWSTANLQNQLIVTTGGQLLGVSDWRFNADETLLAVGGSKMTGAGTTGIVRLYDMLNGQQVAALGGRWIMGEMPDLKTPEDIHNPHMYWVKHFGFLDPEGTRLVSSSGDSVRLWNVDTAIQHGIGVQVSHVDGVDEQLFGFVANDGPGGDGIRIDIRDMVFSPIDPILVFGDRDNQLHLWDYSDLDRIQEQIIDLGQNRFIWDLAFHPDGQVLAIMGNEWLQLWNMQTLTPIDNVPTPLTEGTNNHQVTFSPGGRYLVTIRGHDCEIWAVAP